jgi:hypothetical protein
MRTALVLAGLLLASIVAAQPPRTLSDAQVRQLIIQESMSAPTRETARAHSIYDGAGRSCGARSAWSRAGGAQPICYDREISTEQVKRYRETHRTYLLQAGKVEGNLRVT